VDDHALLRRGIRALIGAESDMQLVAEASTGREALEAFRTHRPDVTLMDLQMPDMTGIEAIIAIRGEFPEAKIIMLSTYSGDVQVVRALKAGARAYLLKGDVNKELLTTIRAVHAGQKRIPAEVASGLAEHAGEDGLTEREIEVVRLIAAGNANKEIEQAGQFRPEGIRIGPRRGSDGHVSAWLQPCDDLHHVVVSKHDETHQVRFMRQIAATLDEPEQQWSGNVGIPGRSRAQSPALRIAPCASGFAASLLQCHPFDARIQRQDMLGQSAKRDPWFLFTAVPACAHVTLRAFLTAPSLPLASFREAFSSEVSACTR
jgi:DNA-binding NarL/FixJ family response regulator